MTARYLVTGAMGCLGAWTIHELVGRGDACVAGDLSADQGRLRAIMTDDQLDRVTFAHLDITDAAAVERVVADQGISHVIHLAALQIPFCRSDPVLGARVNVTGTTTVFEAAARLADQVARVVYTSSAAVYGPPDRYPAGPVAADAPLYPASHYGVYKVANEGTASVYASERGVTSIGLRPYVVYGVGRDQGSTSVPTRAILAAMLDRPTTIPFTGRYGFQLARDVARTLIACSTVPFEGAAVFNAMGGATDVDQFVDAVAAAVPGAREHITIDGPPLPFPAELDDSGLRALLPELVVTPIRDGVAATAAAFRAALDAGRLDVERYLA